VTVASRIVWTDEPTIETLQLRNKAGDVGLTKEEIDA
jgi:hypothetical protein